jgi:hypothetical protein
MMGLPQTLRNLERKSLKTVFLGSQIWFRVVPSPIALSFLRLSWFERLKFSNGSSNWVCNSPCRQAADLRTNLRNACFSCGGTDRTRGDAHPRLQSGSPGWLARPATVGETARISNEPETPFHECERHRPVPADVVSLLAGKKIEVQRIQRTRRGSDRYISDL